MEVSDILSVVDLYDCVQNNLKTKNVWLTIHVCNEWDYV